MTELLPEGYAALLIEVKKRIRSAQYEALKAVNRELARLYWDIGRVITERQAAGSYGDAVVKRLANDLQQEFPGMAGFSWRNPFNMSEFYVAYRDLPKLQPLVATIAWTHNLTIVQRCTDPLAAEVAAMESKAAAGAQFFQIQAIYDLDTFARFRAATRHLAVPILAGLFLVESATMARHINATMRGSHIPEWLIKKLDDSPKPLETMAETAIELARSLATLADGVHVMSLNRLEVVARVIRLAGLA